MGGNQSMLPAAPRGFPYFCVTFRIYDKIKVLHADANVLAIFRANIQSCWPGGLQAEREELGAYEFKFYGNPFSRNTSKEEAISSKRMCCFVLASLRQAGWSATISSDLSRTQDLTTWFFERSQALSSPPQILCVSLSSHDKLQLVNAPAYMVSVLKDAITTSYGYGIQGDEMVGQDYQLKMNGYPWFTADFKEGVFARKALLEMFRRFDAQRYRLYTTANLKGTADCLFFEQEEKDFTGQFGCFEFKLRGFPWNSSGYDAVASRLLITLILQNMVGRGWAVLSALDISRRVNDKAVFILRSCPPSQMPHLCISPNDTDKIRLINAPQELVGLAGQAIRANWTYGIQREGPNAGCYEWKLGGQPWSSFGGNDYAHARHLMCVLLQQFAARGWRVICSADVSAKYVHQQNGPDYPIDVHSWFLTYTGVPQQMDVHGGNEAQMAPSAPPPVGFGFQQQPTPQGESPPPQYSDIMGK